MKSQEQDSNNAYEQLTPETNSSAELDCYNMDGTESSEASTKKEEYFKILPNLNWWGN